MTGRGEGKEKLGDGGVRHSDEGKEGYEPCTDDGEGGEVANMLVGGRCRSGRW
jgi:hypothetical protein